MKAAIKFMKVGSAAFMSHLDLQRTMLRGLRSAGFTPSYSEGFNPHPKISLALPLPLGMESLCEYLEVTLEDGPHVSVDRLNRALPDGIIAVSAETEAAGSARKSLASRVARARYDIAAPMPPAPGPAKLIERYLAQGHIFIEKENRKKGRTDTVDIRPMILSFAAERKIADRARYVCTLSAAAGAALSPLALIRSFYSYCGMPDIRDSEFLITRTAIEFAR
jgi:radical SAM-linked protein